MSLANHALVTPVMAPIVSVTLYTQIASSITHMGVRENTIRVRTCMLSKKIVMLLSQSPKSFVFRNWFACWWGFKGVVGAFMGRVGGVGVVVLVTLMVALTAIVVVLVVVGYGDW